jgi:K+-transporting ATPase ATPase C chain
MDKGCIMKTIIKPAISLFALLTLVTGVAYPLATTGIAQVLFPKAAHGSLVELNGKAVGSSLIGQNFSSPKYFWGRPSATSPNPNNATASSGSNLGPLNPALADAVKGRIQALKGADPGNTKPVPIDLVTASASGLDPDISPAAAEYQVNRVAKARGIAPEQVRQQIALYTADRQFGLLGEPRVNVLALNMALDALK